MAHKVANETIQGYNDVLKIYDSGISITNNQIYQMQLFLSRISRPESLTTGGLIDVNKDLGITIVGLLVSYYLVMVQFNSTTTSVVGQLCNSTVSQIRNQTLGMISTPPNSL
ncbi:uncharacterized protein [Watersipora subatra]|uniref:uncharacterized protein n=1 Tax=Watersipora subatra TaxID=2589382 RepID=UPI00355B6602